VHVVLRNGAQVGKQAANVAYHLYLVQVPHHVHLREHDQFPRSLPPPDESPSFMVWSRRGQVAVRRSDSSLMRASQSPSRERKTIVLQDSGVLCRPIRMER
jgi:hypothetical protein